MRRLVRVIGLVAAAVVGSACETPLGQPDGADEGTGGAGGSAAGGTVGRAMLLSCPDAAPVPGDVCEWLQAGLVCSYPTTTCTCTNGTHWDCRTCPTQQPSASSSCSSFESFNCQYGSVTCGCGQTGWGCGVCPASHPQPGTSCGNTDFVCRYGDDTCRCASDSWTCSTAVCPADPNVVTPTELCTGEATYTCAYSAVPQQSCTCSAGSQWSISCTCPLTPPTNGGACAPSDVCHYDAMDCVCSTGRWDCAPMPCPVTKPATGSTCAAPLSCMFRDGSFCSCDGTTWSC
jgi:hypothetical protein